MYPIEVKSGKKYTTTSLSRFREKYKTRIGESYIIHPKNLMAIYQLMVDIYKFPKILHLGLLMALA